MSEKSAFTLSEVLITLVIIGIIASITVPFVMNNTNKHEFRSSIKKAISLANQALESHYALEGLSASDYTSADSLVENVFKKRMNISSLNFSEFTSSDCSGDGKIFATTDGVIYCISNYSSANLNQEYVPCNYHDTIPCVQEAGPNMWIDVNGLKKPNMATTSSASPKDIYQAQIYSQRVVPYGAATQEVIYGKMNNSDDNSGNTGGNNEDNENNQGNTGNDNKPEEGVKPTPNPDPDIPDNPDIPEYDPNRWPNLQDFLNWLKNIFGGIFG